MVVEIVKPGWVEGKDEFPIMSVDIHPHANKFATGDASFNPIHLRFINYTLKNIANNYL